MPNLANKQAALRFVEYYRRRLEREPAKHTAACLRYYEKMHLAWPDWIANDPRFKKIYAKAHRQGKVVDHIVPLASEIVCGLHVPWNLQPLTDEENQAKSNKWWPDCPFEIDDMFGEYEPYQRCLALE